MVGPLVATFGAAKKPSPRCVNGGHFANSQPIK